MLDTIGMDALNIPKTTKFIGAYVSGTGGVPWSAAELNAFPDSVILRIAQNAGTFPGISGYDVLDIENGAYTPTEAALEVKDRVNAGIQWTIGYGSDSTLATFATAVRALGESVWNGHVYCWYADWNLDQAGAEALLGTEIHGMTCVAVQWASPSSNPKTVTPGSSIDLEASNIDISVIDATRIPSTIRPAPAPVPAPAAPITGMVVWDTSGAYKSSDVESSDKGVTWTTVS